jgi:D-glutamate N-acetyltransferase
MNVAVRRPASKEHSIGIARFVLPQPYLLFLGDVVEPGFAKTAFGLRDWAGDRCVGEYALPGARVSLGLPTLSPKAAVAQGARGMVIGVANPGGHIPPGWTNALIEALEAGLDVISGMHVRLASVPGLQAAAERHGRRLIDVRTAPTGIPIGSGLRRPGRRLLTVGTDCALGKKYTALAITRGLKARGVDATFRATGQTGIMIAGEGMPMDCIVADFAAGAAEILSPEAPDDHVDVIEGQGSLFHPSYAGVALGLLHGSQPDRFVVCHEPGRTHLLGHAEFALPSLEQVIDQTIAMGRITNPDIRCAGISLNTARLSSAEAQQELARVEQRLNLPAADPLRAGPAFERLLDACMS